jgi:hypothetical protein
VPGATVNPSLLPAHAPSGPPPALLIPQRYKEMSRSNKGNLAYVVYAGFEVGVFYNWYVLLLSSFPLISDVFLGRQPMQQPTTSRTNAFMVLGAGRKRASLGSTGYTCTHSQKASDPGISLILLLFLSGMTLALQVYTGQPLWLLFRWPTPLSHHISKQWITMTPRPQPGMIPDQTTVHLRHTR